MKPKRIVCHFLCGAASAIATKIAIEKYRDSGIPIVVVNIFLSREHADNARFLKDCEVWFGLPVVRLSCDEYKSDPHEVWKRVRFLVSPTGAACTRILKREVGNRFWRPGDIDVFGFGAEEADRLDLYIDNNAERHPEAPLIERGFNKEMCLAELKGAGIDIPMMYKLGYRNNNCIGCPKGSAGYWNKIRVDFPDVFEEVAWYEEMLGVPICKVQKDGIRSRVYLNDLPPDAGRHQPLEDISCSYVCTWPGDDEL